MRHPGAAIGPDSVLVWTDDRELTRFERDGSRARFELPFAPLASHIGPHEMWLVDDRGTLHAYSHAGERLRFLPLAESPGTIRQAAVSADGRVALLADEVMVFEHGVMKPWSFRHRRDTAWRESSVDISPDGLLVLTRFATGTGEWLVLGEDGEGYEVTRENGELACRHFMQQLPPTELALANDRIAICEHASQVQIVALGSMGSRHRVAPGGRVQRFHFTGDVLGVLFDYQLVLVENGRETRLDLPEQFADFVLCGDDAVCIHPELGAWWIKTSAG